MNIILIVIVALIMIFSLVISYFQFKEKGFLFNNAYLYASKKERETMNKKPYYKQSGITFLGVAILFLLVLIELIVDSGWLLYIVFGVALALILSSNGKTAEGTKLMTLMAMGE